ncbi:general odorant-binding protein 1-like [Aricia agestis]|uniref:general odorant-binding protein 1-like n=1 Tax=Aricia agestis TaxID=91739 RepID=UPI001C20B56B|nr:general odorant-binding protein 1-like [Aricia agestis]
MKILALLVVVGLGQLDASSDTLKSITAGFFKVLDDCKHELNLGENVLMELYHFWKEDHALLSRDIGCAVVCMSKKLNLLDESGKLHHGNAQEFAVKHGADQTMAQKLITVVHECEGQHQGIDDECLRALEVAKCFRSGMRQLNWAPKLDVIVTEILTEL